MCRCSERAQLSFRGCAACPCAAADNCTRALLANDARCAACTAWGSDLCAGALGSASVLPYLVRTHAADAHARTAGSSRGSHSTCMPDEAG